MKLCGETEQIWKEATSTYLQCIFEEDLRLLQQNVRSSLRIRDFIVNIELNTSSIKRDMLPLS
jgi:hypothetical protein